MLRSSLYIYLFVARSLQCRQKSLLSQLDHIFTKYSTCFHVIEELSYFDPIELQRNRRYY